MRKNRVRILVQNKSESGSAFAERIEQYCFELSCDYKSTLYTTPTAVMTSASDGRQTTTIQFQTEE